MDRTRLICSWKRAIRFGSWVTCSRAPRAISYEPCAKLHRLPLHVSLFTSHVSRSLSHSLCKVTKVAVSPSINKVNKLQPITRGGPRRASLASSARTRPLGRLSAVPGTGRRPAAPPPQKTTTMGRGSRWQERHSPGPGNRTRNRTQARPREGFTLTTKKRTGPPLQLVKVS